MRVLLQSIILAGVFLARTAVPGYGQSLSEDLKTKIDALISAAYQAAAVKFPCKLKARGKAKMLSWQDVGKCLNNANDRVDWEGLSLQLQKIREESRLQAMDMSAAVESSLSTHAIPYEKVFQVGEKRALLPLSNSLLKFLPPDSLLNLPVYDKSGTRIGTFSGSYSFEKTGDISGVRNRLALFQYTDLNGKIQAAAEKLLLDSYGIPWHAAVSEPGFRLPSDKLTLKR